MKPVVKLSADLIEAFAGTFLSPRYDNSAPTPQMHREAWALYASDWPQCEVIAPREHAKSTALTMDYVLAEMLFRVSDYGILISSTEDLAAEQLSNISEELHENDDLRREFGFKNFESDTKTDIICVMNDGHRFRILCRGAEQRIRGRLWKGKRPNLMVMDDAEDDEQVENPERRTKFRNWFFRAAKQAMGRYGKVRVHGTVLHEDALLARLARCHKCKHLADRCVDGICEKCGTEKTWRHLFYRAHAGFDDFSDILWPEQWPESRLRKRRQEFIENMDSAGYSQEFLNNPLDNDEAYLKREDFIPMCEEDREKPMVVCASADFAVSKADKANRSSINVGGKDVENLLHYLHFTKGRWDAMELIDVMFKVQQDFDPQIFFVEDGVIWKTLWPMIQREMQVRDVRINFEPIPSVKDKATRGRSFQRRMRAKQCRFNKQAEGYADFEHELLRFTGYATATLDDQFDSAALLSTGFDKVPQIEAEDFYSEEDHELERGFWNRGGEAVSGRSAVTGY